MSAEQMDEELLEPRYIAEDPIPRDGGRWPEYAHTMTVCVDRWREGLAGGRLYQYYYPASWEFDSLDQLLFAIGRIMDRADMPQRDTRIRTGADAGRGKPRMEEEEDEGPSERQTPYHAFGELRPREGELASFYLRVNSRSRSSVQGVLQDARSGSPPAAFRSETELLILLREALDRAAGG